MPRKVVQGPIRDKERTKQKLLNAVGKILKTEGYLGLKVSKISAVAGFDKKLIYTYFGSTDKLIDEYIRSQDYWRKIDEKQIDSNFSASGKTPAEIALLSQFEGLKTNKELQKIIIWQISEKRSVLRNLFEQREKVFQGLKSSAKELDFSQQSEEFKTTLAILLAGIHYLNLCTVHNSTTFCGINLKSKEGRMKIEKAILDIADFAHQR
ncbi:TetR/AcrR family transcriptional regulator [Chryseobacterium sp. 18068]|uniref:TetR/AcrR family transcriptional regulator n=1 Tax=Chryseobacterium sp. 18068 TaxID=2681414 RepID=UPI001359393D|nr:TetR/AcrR family transcriptional regulator [Chryseobacterium sp. 18068]